MREDQQLKEIADIAIENNSKEKSEQLFSLIKEADYLPLEPLARRVVIALACGWPERLANDGAEVVSPLLEACDFSSGGKEAAISAIRALREPGAIDALCHHWMETGAAGDDLATLLLSASHSPSDPAERALFWLLIGQIQRYEELDLDGSLLVQGQAAASTNVRKRFATAAALAGRMEWLGAMQQSKPLDQFDKDDWTTTVELLKRAGDPNAIWHWALRAPPTYAQELLKMLPACTLKAPQTKEITSSLQRLAEQMPEVPDSHHLLPNFCTHTLSGHSSLVWSPVHSIAWSPDGRCLASGSMDHTIRLWDPASGACTRTLLGHSDSVWSIAWSPDGRCLASGSVDKTIRLWDPANGTCTLTLSGHLISLVNSIAWSPDGRCLASGSFDHNIRLWDPASGACTLTLMGHSDEVKSIAWSPDGRCLASGSYDKTIRLWDPASGTCTLTFTDHHMAYVDSIAWSPDGRCLASGIHNYTIPIRLWDPTSGVCSHTLSGHRTAVQSIAWSPDGRCLASGSGDKTIRLWDPSSGTCIRILSGHSDQVRSIAWSPDGRRLASGSFDNTIRVWANEFLSLLAMPLACYGERQWKLLSTLQASKQLEDWQRPWIEFIAALGSVIRRFDVTVDDGDTQSTASPFEVEIDG